MTRKPPLGSAASSTGCTASIDMAALARSVDMSPSTFHRHFKSGRANVSLAAYAAGYASPSHFTNDYRALFGLASCAEKRAAA